MPCNKKKDNPRETKPPLWNPLRVCREITEGAIFQTLDETARRKLSDIPDIEEKVRGGLLQPKPLDICMPVLDAVLAAQYYEIFEALNPPRNMAVYEPCAGASVPVILASEAYSDGRAQYVTINLNRNLREQMQKKIAHLKMNIRIIEDHAQNARDFLEAGSFDIACFHHAVNDILQTAVSEPRGMDTTAIDWFPSERHMIEWLAEDEKAGRLEQRGKPELMQSIEAAVQLVHPGGFLIFDHFNWRKFIGVAWFPWDLFYNLIPMTRQWIEESALPLREIRLNGVDPQWWLILQVI